MKPYSSPTRIVFSAPGLGSCSLKTTVEASVAVTDSNGITLRLPPGTGSVKPLPRPSRSVIVVCYVAGRQCSPIHRCLVMPVNALADVKDNRCIVGRLPAFRQLPGRDLQRDVLTREGIFVPVYCPIDDA